MNEYKIHQNKLNEYNKANFIVSNFCLNQSFEKSKSRDINKSKTHRKLINIT